MNKKKKKKMNLDSTIIIPTVILIKIEIPPRYLPTISPILKDVKSINTPHPSLVFKELSLKIFFSITPGNIINVYS